ncbi:GNAT family N-acetyltransferase [Flavobacteriaceae bacterium TK19130]|nr:GNAT family N-acetyltransferase [Thermobacterium salinum]
MKVYIETERLIIRNFEDSDADGIFKLDSDPEVHTYLGNNPIKTIDQAKEIIDRVKKHYEVNGIGRLAIIDRKTNDFIGWSGIKFEQGVREFDYFDLGYRLRKEYWGKGIATEASIESLKYGFDERNLQKIGAGADIDNLASNRVLQKVGFKFIDRFDFEEDPHNFYEITRSEWNKAKRTANNV